MQQTEVKGGPFRAKPQNKNNDSTAVQATDEITRQLNQI